MSSRIRALQVTLVTILPVFLVIAAHGRRWVGLG
jgi:hypothetical protein